MCFCNTHTSATNKHETHFCLCSFRVNMSGFHPRIADLHQFFAHLRVTGSETTSKWWNDCDLAIPAASKVRNVAEEKREAQEVFNRSPNLKKHTTIFTYKSSEIRSQSQDSMGRNEGKIPWKKHWETSNHIQKHRSKKNSQHFEGFLDFSAWPRGWSPTWPALSAHEACVAHGNWQIHRTEIDAESNVPGESMPSFVVPD